MMTPDYTELDAAILEAILCERNPLYTRDVAAVSDPIATDKRVEGVRVIDRRLQALRKAGRISYSRADGWRLA